MLRRLLILSVFVLMLAVVPAAGAATITPTRFDDPAYPTGYTCPIDCSFHGALNAAEAGETIALEAGTYDLASPVNFHGTVEVVGKGARKTAISSVGSVALIHIEPTGSARFSDLSITSGEGFSAGALWNEGEASLTRVSVRGNTGTGGSPNIVGAAISNWGTLNVNGSTFSDNHGTTTGSETAHGGALYNTGTVTISNSTFHDNTLSTVSGASLGGAVYATSESHNSFYNVTFGTGNDTTALAASSLGGQAYAESGAVWRVGNTVFADSLGATIADTCVAAPADDISLGGNVDSTPGNCGTDPAIDHTNVDPGLESFGDHGGQTDTQPIAAGTPGVDFGIHSICSSTALGVSGIDQRGGKRLIAPFVGCDSGATERDSLAEITISGSAGAVSFPQQFVPLSLSLTNHGPDDAANVWINGPYGESAVHSCSLGTLGAGLTNGCSGNFFWDGSTSYTYSLETTVNSPSGIQPSVTLNFTVPRFSSISMKPSKLRPARRGPTLGKKKVKGAAAIKYAGIDLSVLSAAVQKRAKTSWKTLSTTRIAGAQPSGRLYFTGRIKNKPMKKGSYRLALTPMTTTGAPFAPSYLSFSVK